MVGWPWLCRSKWQRGVKALEAGLALAPASAFSQLPGLWMSSLTSGPQCPHQNNGDIGLLGDKRR